MRDQILREFQKKKQMTAVALAEKFGLSRQAVHRYLRDLIRHGVILKQGTSRKTSFYVLNDPDVLREIGKENRRFQKRYRAEGLQEDLVYREISNQSYLLVDLNENSKNIFHFAFTEMMNNAIDHSQTQFIDVAVEAYPHKIEFMITDQGVGAFENIRSKKHLSTELEALQDLLKGKQTTLPEYHSGEGIFFTSKSANRFQLESHRKKLIIDNHLEDTFVEDIRYRRGTRVTFEVENQSKKAMQDVFKQYTNEDFQFHKTQVTVKLFQEGEEYISRSQAKRLLHAMDLFQEIVLDFNGVKTIGQGFADEIFRVFKQQHPEIEIVSVNCHENVQFMIDRARAERLQP